MFEKWKLPSPSMAVSWLALAVALGGTAVAATVTLVKITDNSGTRVAVVDTQGRLRTTAAPMAPSNTFTAFQFIDTGVTNILGPTQASLVLSTITTGNYYDQYNGAKLRVIVNRLESATASCSSPVESRTVGVYYLSPGQSFHATFPEGIALRPKVAGNYVCLTATMQIQGNLGGYYLSDFLVSGYVESGTFVSSAMAPTSAADIDDPRPRRSR